MFKTGVKSVQNRCEVFKTGVEFKTGVKNADNEFCSCVEFLSVNAIIATR